MLSPSRRVEPPPPGFHADFALSPVANGLQPSTSPARPYQSADEILQSSSFAEDTIDTRGISAGKKRKGSFCDWSMTCDDSHRRRKDVGDEYSPVYNDFHDIDRMYHGIESPPSSTQVYRRSNGATVQGRMVNANVDTQLVTADDRLSFAPVALPHDQTQPSGPSQPQTREKPWSASDTMQHRYLPVPVAVYGRARSDPEYYQFRSSTVTCPIAASIEADTYLSRLIGGPERI